MHEISKQVITASIFVIFLPFGLAMFWRKKLTGPMFVIFCYLILGIAAQLISFITKEYQIKNLPLLHLYTVIEFSWITWFYHQAMPVYLPERRTKVIIVIFSVAAALNTLFLQPVTQFNTYIRTSESILVIIFSLLFFYKIISEMKIQRLEKEPLFWINVGFLIYFSGSTLLFIFSNYILPFKNTLNLYVWSLHAIFSILLYLIQSIGIWMAAHKPT